MSEEDFNLKDEMKQMSMDQRAIMTQLSDETVRRVKKKSWKLPFGIRMRSRRAVKRGKFLCVWLGSNHVLDFKIVNVVGGLIQINDYQYKAYEEGAIYHYKRLPVVVVLEWRLTLVGGKTDFVNANDLGVGDFAQQTIIRAIEKIEIDKEVGKKRGKLPIFWVVVGLGVIIYLVSKSFGA